LLARRLYPGDAGRAIALELVEHRLLGRAVEEIAELVERAGLEVVADVAVDRGAQVVPRPLVVLVAVGPSDIVLGGNRLGFQSDLLEEASLALLLTLLLARHLCFDPRCAAVGWDA